jgi:outer membrane protein assembly factor BamB
VAAALQCLVIAVAAFIPGGFVMGLMSGVLGGLLILLWWLFASRAPWLERLGALALMVGGVLATRLVVHPSIANAGMERMYYFFAIPVLSLALVAWAAACAGLASAARRAWLVAAILLACGVFTLVRTGGVSGDGGSDLHWRWTPTPEERLLARGGAEAAAPPSAPAAKAPEPPPPASVEPAAAPPEPAPRAAKPPVAPVPAPAAEPRLPPASAAESAALWPGFRGPDRDGVVHGVKIETDWSKSPPRELWRQPIGPGWSSFAVRGDRVYTQEQRGDDEDVSCYDLGTGKLVWRHRDTARFWESNGGPGPRGTPTLADGRVYTFGATGIVNALDAGSGALLWSRNAASDTGAKLPGWGFASSPLVLDDMVIVAASGRLVAYDAATGEPRWLRQTRGGGYSSPHRMTVGGVAQVLLLNGYGVTSVAPADGAVLWEHAWEGAAILQPARTADGDVLITTGDMMGGVGTRRLAVARGDDGWTVAERWTSLGLKPYYNDYVVHRGHAYGFDGGILACLDLADGKRKWKGGRYGHGQLVLLPEQDLLLVLSEEGELALVGATPEQFKELARFPAIQGKTWNHPVLVGGVLLVRNGEEMAAFRLALVGS